MAYPSDNKPRRRLQAVPTMAQMVRRRAASPQGVVKNGVGLMGPPVQQGGQAQRRLPNANYAPPLPVPGQNGAPGGRPNPNPFPGGIPGGGGPGPITNGNQPPPVAPPVQNNIPDPNSFTDPSYEGTRNPLEHQAWWAAHGWQYNPGQRKFVFVGVPQTHPGAGGGPTTGGGQGGGGQNGGGNGGNNNGGGGNPAPGGGPTVPPGSGVPGDANGDGIPDDLPLDSYFEAQRRQLNDALMAKLGFINPQREIVAANQGLQSARLNTNEGVDTAHLLESLAGRGAFGGGVQARDQGYLGTDYLRQRQDLGQNVASQYSDLARQESEAQMGYSSGLMEALLALAQRQAQSQYAAVPTGVGTGGLPALQDNTLGGGGGGGNWQPSWTPSWKPPKQRKGQ